MYAKVLGLSLFACQIILNGCSVIHESSESVSVEDGTSATRPSGLPEGYVAFPDVKVAYKLYRNSSWNDGRDGCVAEGANLAVADSLPKIQHLNSLKTDEDSGKWVHVGIYRSNATGEWVRIDNGLPVTSIPWIENNPDSDGDCTGISVTGDGLLNYRCHWSHEIYACEISL